MLKLRWILFLIAVLVAAAAWRVWSVSEDQSGATLLASVERRMDREKRDFEAILRELELGLRLARAEGDTESEGKLLYRRADVHFLRKAFDLSLADCRELLATTAPSDPAVLYLAARAARGGKQTELALGFATRLREVDPTYPAVDQLIGYLEIEVVDSLLEEVRRILDETLPTELALEGLEWARRASALPGGYPARHQALDSLRALLPAGGAGDGIPPLVEEASEHLAAARQAFVAGLAALGGPSAVEGMQDVLTRAGHDASSATLGLVALQRRLQPSYTSVLVRTALSLARMEEPHTAKELIRTSIAKRPPLQSHYHSLEAGLLLDWCVLLRDLELWPELNNAATTLNSRRHEYNAKLDLEAAPHYFLGVSRIGMKNNAGALTSLDKVSPLRRPTEIFPGEASFAALAQADISGVFSQPARAEAALRGAMQRRPPPRDGGAAAKAYGQVFLRLATIETERKHWAAVVHLLSQALRFLPARREVLEPQWRAAGENLLALRKTTIEAVAKSLEKRGLQLPNRDVDSHQLCMLALLHLEQNHFYVAHNAAQRVLGNYPGFPLALEIDARALRAMGRNTEAVEQLLTLGEEGSGGPDLHDDLRAIPAAAFSPAQRLRWYRVDPRGAALREVAPRLMREGHVELALSAIRAQTDDSVEPADRILAAELLGKLGRWKESQRALSHIQPEDPEFAAAAGLVLLAGLRTRADSPKGDPLRRAMLRVYSAPRLEGAGFDRAIDALQGTGQREEVRMLLAHLEDQLKVHPPGLLLRMAISAVTDGELDTAAEMLDRAEAYLPEGEAQLGRVLMALDAGDPDLLREAAKRMLGENFAGTPHREALLRVLTGEFGVANRLSVRAYELAGSRDATRLLSRMICNLLAPPTASPEDGAPGPENPVLHDDGTWLATATFGGTVSTTEVVGLLLALESDPWAAWALARLRDLPPSVAATTWPTLLEAVALLRLGVDDEAEALLVRLTRPAENVPFAWDLREDVVRARHGTDPDTDALRALHRARAKAMGAEDLETSEMRLLWAEEQRAANRMEDAVRVLAEGVLQDPDRLDLGVALARYRVEAGDRAAAVTAYDRLFDDFGTEETSDLVPEYITVLRRAALHGEITNTSWWARLEALASQRPLDPAPVLELARRTAETAGDRADGGIARAQERMDRYRARTGHAPIESLRPGAAARWIAFLAEYDPSTALALADAELLADPSVIELWRARAGALAADERRGDAVTELGILLRMVSDPDTQLQLAGLLAELGQGPALVVPTLQRLGAAGAIDQPAEQFLVYGRALLQGNPKQKDEGIRLLLSAWSKRPPGPPHGIMADIGRELAEGLLLRGAKKDDPLAREVLDLLHEGAADPLRRDYFRALANLIGPE